MLQHYDVIILGGGLASRIAASLLAKEGKRVYAFRDLPRPFPGWFMPSLHLERLLQRLDGRSCITSATPFQVLTKASRLDLHGPLAFEEELRREFPQVHALLKSRLDALRELGERLEQLIWAAGGLPILGWRSRWRFFLKSLRYGMNVAALRRPLASHFASMGDDTAHSAISALFAGLALTPFAQLSIAEGALLWSSVCRGEGVSRSGLEELLRRRYEQSHGEEGDLSRVLALQNEGGRLAVVLKDNHRLTADHLLLGSPEVLSRVPRDWSEHAPRHQQHKRFSTSAIQGDLPPLLASEVILGDADPVMRLLFTSSVGRTSVLVDQAGVDLVPSEILHRRLTDILPFATFRMEASVHDTSAEPMARKSSRAPFPGIQSLRLKGQVLYCNGGDVCPSLGTLGEVLIGMTVARQLGGDAGGKKP
jgi:hypothetical protein